MNDPSEKSNEPSWDDLATELGLEPSAAPALPAPPKPAAAPETPRKKAEAKPAEEREETPTPFGGHEIHHAHVTEITLEVTKVSDGDGAEETVVEDGPDVFDDEDPHEEEVTDADAKEGEGVGRRRRRRRRRKKGNGEAGATELPAADDVEEPGSDETADAAMDEESPAEIVGEAGAELEEDDMEVPTAAAIDEELDEDDAQPLPEWKVTSWTDLVATLYRPQDR
jgi:hypothetical protein